MSELGRMGNLKPELSSKSFFSELKAKKVIHQGVTKIMQSLGNHSGYWRRLQWIVWSNPPAQMRFNQSTFTQDHLLLCFGNLQGWKFHILSEQPVGFHSKKAFPIFKRIFKLEFIKLYLIGLY